MKVGVAEFALRKNAKLIEPERCPQTRSNGCLGRLRVRLEAPSRRLKFRAPLGTNKFESAHLLKTASLSYFGLFRCGLVEDNLCSSFAGTRAITAGRVEFFYACRGLAAQHRPHPHNAPGFIYFGPLCLVPLSPRCRHEPTDLRASVRKVGGPNNVAVIWATKGTPEIVRTTANQCTQATCGSLGIASPT